MPSNATIADLCLDDLQAAILQKSVQVPLRNVAQVSIVTVSLLSLLMKTLPGQCAAAGANFTVSTWTWSLSALARFWYAFGPDLALLSYSLSSSPSSLTLFLDSARKLLVHMAGIKASSAIEGRCALVLSHITASFLNVKMLPLVPLVEKMLCLILLEFAYGARRSPPIRHVFVDQIMPVIRSLNEDLSRLDGFGQDLQVHLKRPLFKAYWLTKRQTTMLVIVGSMDGNLLASLSPLPEDKSPSFQDLEVHQTYCKCFNGLRSNHAGAAERPRKRIRLSAAEQGSKDLCGRSKLIKTINKLLGFQDNSELTDLGQVAMLGGSLLSRSQRY